MSIRIRKLTEGYLVSDDTGWEAAAVTLTDAESLARHRVHPRVPSPPPSGIRNSPDGAYNGAAEFTGYAEATPPQADPVVHPLAERQFGQATGETGPCVGSLCGSD